MWLRLYTRALVQLRHSERSEESLFDLRVTAFGYSRGKTMPPCDWYLPFLVLVADFAGFIALEEQHLAEAFVGVNFRRAAAWCC